MSMDILVTPLSGVLVLTPKRFHDRRGFFLRGLQQAPPGQRAGIDVDFVQDNFSMSRPRGTLRGLHFQREPFAQVKLVSVVTGVARDVVVDIRHSSPTFGQHFSVLLSAEEGNREFHPHRLRPMVF